MKRMESDRVDTLADIVFAISQASYAMSRIMTPGERRRKRLVKDAVEKLETAIAYLRMAKYDLQEPLETTDKKGGAE